MTSPSNGAHDPIAAAASGPSLYAPNSSSSPADEKRLSTTSSNLRGYDVGNDLGYGASTQRTPSTGRFPFFFVVDNIISLFLGQVLLESIILMVDRVERMLPLQLLFRVSMFVSYIQVWVRELNTSKG